MSSVGLIVSGKVIGELSSKIPSNIFALNELTKNAYDAFASKVEITIDSKTSQLVITDDGSGMDLGDIKKLLHIGYSEKKYGKRQKNNGLERFVQGSKGLGFLSVFKFGYSVKWETAKQGEKNTFSINRDEITERKNLSGFKVLSSISETKDKGTKITIDLDEKNLLLLNKYFDDSKNTLKSVNAFYDKTFEVKLKTINVDEASGALYNFTEVAKDSQFCYIDFCSNTDRVRFYRLGKLIKDIPFKLSSNKYSIHAEIMVYSFKTGGKKKISKLYMGDTEGTITPLLFINDNLFNNYKLFDSNINRGVRSGESMPQMTGCIRVYCSDQELDYNSDRTNFVENELTSGIGLDLEKLNKLIQKTASEIKTEDKKKDGNIITGLALPDGFKSNETSQNTNENKFKISSTSTAQIILNSKYNNIKIPSPQIDFYNLISKATDSSGNKINNNEIKIKINGELCVGNILHSITNPERKEIEFIYNDVNTGILVEKAILNFHIPLAEITGSDKKHLFPLLANKSYKIQIPHVANLISQISKVYSMDKDAYYELISCSLRSIFEITNDFMRDKHPIIFSCEISAEKKKTIYSNPTLRDVVQVINFVINNKNMQTLISKNLGIQYSSFTNMLSIESFFSSVKKAHLGAHNATVFLDPTDIRELAMKAGHYAAICNVMLYQINKKVIEESVITPLE